MLSLISTFSFVLTSVSIILRMDGCVWVSLLCCTHVLFIVQILSASFVSIVFYLHHGFSSIPFDKFYLRVPLCVIFFLQFNTVRLYIFCKTIHVCCICAADVKWINKLKILSTAHKIYWLHYTLLPIDLARSKRENRILLLEYFFIWLHRFKLTVGMCHFIKLCII